MEKTPPRSRAFYTCPTQLLTAPLLAIILLLTVRPSAAQVRSGQLTLLAGSIQYNGDLSYDAFSTARTRPAIAIGWSMPTPTRLRWNAQLLYGRLRADDRDGRNASRNLSFETPLWELSSSARLEFNTADTRPVIPYLEAGLALFHINPYTRYNGNKVRLFPLTTQGQGLPGHDGTEPIRRSYLAIPISGGLNIRLSAYWRMDIDITLRKTFTDNIDDVGGIYPDPTQLLAAKGPTAVALSHRGNGPFPNKGALRGNPGDDDWYSTFSIRLRTPIKRSPRTPPPITDNQAPLLPDRDGDGVPDPQDQCPLVAGTAKYGGCPIPDTDRDGINDEKDRCPNVAGSSRYDGCPIPDTDKDGINDEADKCPDQPGQSRYDGCPIPDTDKDGVNDDIDNCRTTPGQPASQGCPIPQIDAANMRFLPGTAKHTPAALTELDRLADWLKDSVPNIRIRIQAQPLPFRQPQTAITLAEKRAAATFTYLLGKGIKADRLEYLTLPLDTTSRTPTGNPGKDPVTILSFLVDEKR